METYLALGCFRLKVRCCIANFHTFSSTVVLRLRLSQVPKQKSILTLVLPRFLLRDQFTEFIEVDVAA
jgi:hypothetical protein